MKNEMQMWCIHDGDHFNPFTINRTRSGCIDDYMRNWDLTWRQFRKKFGASCQKVLVTIESIK